MSTTQVLHYMGFEPGTHWFYWQLAILAVLAYNIVIDERRMRKERQEGRISSEGAKTILGTMEIEQLRHNHIRQLYGVHVRQGYCTPLSVLRIFAKSEDIKHHVMNDNYYFYHDTSGFMTVIPAHHIQTNR